jgi:diguanylate cyclase (GGDEF)-like protein/putative nucleotidyltransferase with HDIG domain
MAERSGQFVTAGCLEKCCFVSKISDLHSDRPHVSNQQVPFWADSLTGFRQNICVDRETTHPFGAKAFIGAMAVGALGCFVFAATHWHSSDPIKFLCYLVVAILASSLKIKLPGVNGTMSVNFLFILLGVLELSFAETLVIGFAAVFVQCYWRPANGPKLIHVIFNLSQLPVGAAISYGTYVAINQRIPNLLGLTLLLVSMTYFAFNTMAMALIIRLTENKPILKVWSECYSWSLPYYLVGAALVGLVNFLNRHIGWQSSLLVLPPVYLMYRSYRLYLGKLEDEKKHAEQVSSLHLKTIEALALAIDAKDHTTHEHLQRVRVYAMELAKDLGLSEDETEALQAASVLHDIGKLAVPEHIVSKPGKLTPEEFEKMKIHPIIGAEILEQVEFPYPVVPIVRSHHEKWDGSGYPNGLKGEEIPIGARILSAVDCLDALASDRQYRRALPLDEAMAKVAADAGKSFDPQVVEILQRRYIELEKLAHAQPSTPMAKLSKDVKVERGAAPAAGFAEGSEVPPAGAVIEQKKASLISVAEAHQEAQMLFELSHDLGRSLRLDDMLSMLAIRLKRLVSYDAMAVYLLEDECLVPAFAGGDNFRLFSSLKIPIGQGLSGWVAQNNKPILNGNPSVEPGYLNDPTKYSSLRSALAVPLEGSAKVVAVLALYRASADAFTGDDLRILQAIQSKLGFTVEDAVHHRGEQDSVSTDYLTGLPNARSLFLHLDTEIARCERTGEPVGVFVADLDGFKQINETQGQAQGNKLLQALAAFLRDSCRQYDYAARLGGDEFVLVAPGLRAEAASEMMGRIEGILRPLRNSGAEQLTISVGQSFYPEDGKTAEDLLTAAHRKMYALKRTRNQQSSRPLSFAASSRS